MRNPINCFQLCQIMITRVPTIDQSDMEFVYGDDKPHSQTVSESPAPVSPDIKEKTNPRCLKRSARIVLDKMESWDEDNMPDYLLKVRLIHTRKTGCQNHFHLSPTTERIKSHFVIKSNHFWYHSFFNLVILLHHHHCYLQLMS